MKGKASRRDYNCLCFTNVYQSGYFVLYIRCFMDFYCLGRFYKIPCIKSGHHYEIVLAL